MIFHSLSHDCVAAFIYLLVYCYLRLVPERQRERGTWEWKGREGKRKSERKRVDIICASLDLDETQPILLFSERVEFVALILSRTAPLTLLRPCSGSITLSQSGSLTDCEGKH